MALGLESTWYVERTGSVLISVKPAMIRIPIPRRGDTAEKKQDEDVDPMLERVLQGELIDHLGYEKRDARRRAGGSSRTGRTRKRGKSDPVEIEIAVPRDRDGSFDSKLVSEGQRRLPGFDEQAIALMGRRSMTMRGIQGHLKEFYPGVPGLEVRGEFTGSAQADGASRLPPLQLHCDRVGASVRAPHGREARRGQGSRGLRA